MHIILLNWVLFSSKIGDGELETFLISNFEESAKYGPSILVIDDIDILLSGGKS